MSTYITFHGGNGGGGGGGGGAASPALGASTNTGSGQNSHQGNIGSGSTDQAQSMLLVHREHATFDVASVAADAKGYMTTVPVIRIPKRLVFMANGLHYGGTLSNFTFMVDILLVPVSFNVQTWAELYQEPYNPKGIPQFMGTRRLRDNIILLRRFAAQGSFVGCGGDQFEIPEDIRTRSGYRLVITCPVYQYSLPYTVHSLVFQLEMEF